jgi:DNA-binding response OmpR family regulator
MKATVLIVEDDSDFLELLEHRLGREGYETLGFLNTRYVRQALSEESVDLILMDRNLPDIEGSEFIALLREQGMEIPVIYITAKDSKFHIQEGFLRGADDYICKPFEMQELLMRVNAVLRRTKTTHQSKKVLFRDIELDLKGRSVTIGGEPVDLTKLEFDLLHTLIEHQKTVLRRDFLLKHVWGKGDDYQGRTVNVAINRLKEKIDPDKSKEYIKAVRGVGYSIH